jgi:hypothetical protein
MTTKLPNGNKTFQMPLVYSKWTQNITTFSIARPPKIYPNRDFLVWKYSIWQPRVSGGEKNAKNVLIWWKSKCRSCTTGPARLRSPLWCNVLMPTSKIPNIKMSTFYRQDRSRDLRGRSPVQEDGNWEKDRWEVRGAHHNTWMRSYLRPDVSRMLHANPWVSLKMCSTHPGQQWS